MSQRNRTSKCSPGFSLLEMMVAMGLASVLALAVMSNYADSNLALQKAQMLTTTKELKTRMEALLKDPYSDPINTWKSAWQNTTGLQPDNVTPYNATMNCLRVNTSPGCTGFVGPRDPFTLYGRGNGVAVSIPEFYSITTPGDETRGFTYAGVPCNTFNDTIATGDATCVFGYVIEWNPVCPAGSPCINPPVNVNATLHYRPLNGKPLAPLSPENYSITNFVRSAQSMTKSFRLFAKPGVGAGGGACTAVGAPTNRTWAIKSAGDDPYSMIGSQAVQTEVILAYGGTYNCTATASAYAVDGFIIELKLNNASLAPPGIGMGSAPVAASVSGSATVEAVFNAVSGDKITLSQGCSSPSASTDAMGKALPGVNSTFATLNCYIEN